MTGTHALRHSFAVHLLHRGVPVKTIGDTLGHRNMESTNVYLRLAVEDLREVALPLPPNARAENLVTGNWHEGVPKIRFSIATPLRARRFQSSFAASLKRYLIVRRVLGRAYIKEENILRRWDDFLFRHDIGVSGFDAVAFHHWVDEIAYLNTNIRRKRLRVVRNFLLFYGRDHPRTWIPNPVTFPRLVPYTLPHLVSTAEMARVLATARHLSPLSYQPPRAETIHLALALLFCCGLRRGELLRLRLAHYDERACTLRVEATKFNKSRLVPLHSAVAHELNRFLVQRRRCGLPVAPESPLFWSGQPDRKLRGLSANALMQNWRLLCVSCGVLDVHGRPPALHHLRHSMAVTALQRCYAAGINPQARLPHLATYLGHVSLISTHHYLHLTPELGRVASDRFHQSCTGLFKNGGAV